MKTYVIVMIVSITIIVIGIVLYFLLRNKEDKKGIAVVPFVENFQHQKCSCQSISETYTPTTATTPAPCPSSTTPTPKDPNNPEHVEFANKLTIDQIFLVYCGNKDQSPKKYNDAGHRGDCPGRKHVFLYRNGKYLPPHNPTINGQVIQLKDLDYDVGIDISYSGSGEIGGDWSSDKNKDDKIASSTDTCHSYELQILETGGNGEALFTVTLEQK
tara:strand:- start:471 stop:1115 length:645 start_codon:yes stop_codon:yes gene_type:complete